MCGTCWGRGSRRPGTSATARSSLLQAEQMKTSGARREAATVSRTHTAKERTSYPHAPGGASAPSRERRWPAENKAMPAATVARALVWAAASVSFDTDSARRKKKGLSAPGRRRRGVFTRRARSAERERRSAGAEPLEELEPPNLHTLRRPPRRAMQKRRTRERTLAETLSSCSYGRAWRRRLWGEEGGGGSEKKEEGSTALREKKESRGARAAQLRSARAQRSQVATRHGAQRNGSRLDALWKRLGRSASVCARAGASSSPSPS